VLVDITVTKPLPTACRDCLHACLLACLLASNPIFPVPAHLRADPLDHSSKILSCRVEYLPVRLQAPDIAHHMFLRLIHPIHLRRHDAAPSALNLLGLVDRADMSLRDVY